MSPAEIGLGLLVAIMGGGNIYNWFSSRGKTKVDLIKLAQTIAAETITALDGRIKELEEKVDTLSAHIVSLESLLLEKGITPPPRPKAKQ